MVPDFGRKWEKLQVTIMFPLPIRTIAMINKGLSGKICHRARRREANWNGKQRRDARSSLNVGHQRAIAVGLVGIARRKDLDRVFIMDFDK